jgi:hypothetical protein
VSLEDKQEGIDLGTTHGLLREGEYQVYLTIASPYHLSFQCLCRQHALRLAFSCCREV